jgi:hypothetical protein
MTDSNGTDFVFSPATRRFVTHQEAPMPLIQVRGPRPFVLPRHSARGGGRAIYRS